MAAAAGMKKKMLATLVGCNYAGRKGLELQGSINSVHAMRAVLLDRFGFAPADITVLTDDDPKKLPTNAAIKGALDEMVKLAAPGDVLFFYFCGQGTRSDYADGPGGDVDHIIAPCDFDDGEFITDLYFRELVDRVPAGATFTMVSDSNESGGLIDQEKEQQIGGPAAMAAANARRTDDVHVVKAGDAGILLSACQEDQLSADIVPAGGGGKAYGAFTWALLTVLAADPAPMSNREVVRRAREVMSAEWSKREMRTPQYPSLSLLQRRQRRRAVPGAAGHQAGQEQLSKEPMEATAMPTLL